MRTASAAPANVTGVDPMTVAGLSDAALRAELDAAFARRRAEDALIVRLAGEVAERSRQELGNDGLARRSGNTNAADLVAWSGRISHFEAGRLCQVGIATAPRMSLAGETLPPEFAALATAVDTGAVTVEAASHIITQLSTARRRADPGSLIVAEHALIDFALEAPANDVRRLALRWKDALDADGVEPREAELVAGRILKRRTLSNGMKLFQIEADPLNAAYLDAVVDAEIAAARRKARIECDAPDSETPIDDPRTIGQVGADAIFDLAKHMLSCENSAPALTSTTVIVRMTLDSLTTGLGEAEVIGQEQSISASTARRLAADAEIIPAVLGGQSQVLDFGRSRRPFTRAQRLAMLERDGGCPCGCARAPVFLHAHHVDWWHRDQGRTDLRRGVLLCSKAHHLVHDYGWTVRFEKELPYLIPPPSVDPKRTPRRRARPPTPSMKC